MGWAAELLEMDVYDLRRLAHGRGIELGAMADQYKKVRKTAEKLRRKLLAGT